MIPTVADNSCANGGLQWAYIADLKLSGANQPANLRVMPPSATGIANPATLAGGWTGNCDYSPSQLSNFYGYELGCNDFALMYRGFVYAGISGTYNFIITLAEDLVSVWVGDADVVRDNYGLSNTFIDSRRNGKNPFATYTATAGTYIPLRILLNQATGPFAVGLTIQAPDGTIILDGRGQNQNLVQFACDGSTRAWLPWGAELPS